MCVRENLQQKPPPFQKGGTANMRAFVSAKCAVNDFFKKSFLKKQIIFKYCEGKSHDPKSCLQDHLRQKNKI